MIFPGVLGASTVPSSPLTLGGVWFQGRLVWDPLDFGGLWINSKCVGRDPLLDFSCCSSMDPRELAWDPSVEGPYCLVPNNLTGLELDFDLDPEDLAGLGVDSSLDPDLDPIQLVELVFCFGLAPKDPSELGLDPGLDPKDSAGLVLDLGTPEWTTVDF